ncbi:hypothetical protein [Mycolicibacterium aichiense]|uniref:Uncharacterized protein n=1 Tax=Mycolicibacterium aichiense TaxID=1799 RepID=A0AAD1HMN0_9MYCO|nr:hypothetical protein [Mycolicibacterium aichiense]MCV7019914.1 hypothetical protein [Mycolicibacterium aichiense]BBX07505.1 hypothetical protein MAIC_23080 [Mycolicibacterium aichiense]STZ81319.1 Uncharacterised protein [Mycolicibacterium aichiense]
MTAGRLRLRRRLLLWSAPVVLLAVMAVIKMISVMLIGDSAATHFSRGDGAALQNDASKLEVLNVIEPAKAPFARGSAAVLEGRLADADTDFSRALAGGQSCAARVNLELVRETQGDVAAAAGRTDAAGERYRSALRVVAEAPAGCFAGNDDPQPDRRTVRAEADARLAAKIAALQSVPPPPPPEPDAVPPPPPPPPPPAGAAPAESDTPPPALGPSGQGLSDIAADRLPSPGAPPSAPHQLGGGDPLDRLRQLLTDAASSGSDAG